MFRKIIVGLLLLQVLLCAAIPVFAASRADFTVLTSADQAAPGDEIVVTVKVTAGACSSMGFRQQFDADVFEVVSGKCLVSNASLSDFSKTEGAVALLETPGTFDGELCSFVLRVKADAPAGTTTVGGKCAVKNGGDALQCELNVGTVTIVAAPTQQEKPPAVSSEPTEAVGVTDSTEPQATQPEEETPDTKPEEEPADKDLAPSENDTTASDVLTTGPDYSAPKRELPTGIIVIVGLLLVVIIGVIIWKRKR